MAVSSRIESRQQIEAWLSGLHRPLQVGETYVNGNWRTDKALLQPPKPWHPADKNPNSEASQRSADWEPEGKDFDPKSRLDGMFAPNPRQIGWPLEK